MDFLQYVGNKYDEHPTTALNYTCSRYISDGRIYCEWSDRNGLEKETVVHKCIFQNSTESLMKESPFFVTSYTYDCTSYLIATFIQNLVLILDEFNLVLEYPASTSTSTTTTNPLRKQLVCSSLPPSTLLTGGNLLDNQTNCELTTSSNEVFNWPSSNDIFGNPDYSLSSLSSLIYNMSTNATNSSDLQLDTKGDYILLTYVQLTLVIAFILFGSIGNLLVCLAIGLDKKLHNVTNMFLFSLAIADLLVSLFVMPMGAIPAFWGKYFIYDALIF